MISDWKAVISQVRIRSIRQLLSELASVNDEPAPVISLVLTSGQTLTGRVLAFEAGHQQSLVALYVENHVDRFVKRMQVVYIDVQYIAALSFDDIAAAPASARLITGGKATAPVQLAPVSKLAFQRYLKEQSDRLASALRPDFRVEAEPSLLESMEDFSYVQALAERTVAVLSELLQEQLGREALLLKVQRVIFQADTQFGLRLVNGELLLTLQPDSGAENIPAQAQLKSTLEAVL